MMLQDWTKKTWVVCAVFAAPNLFAMERPLPIEVKPEKMAKANEVVTQCGWKMASDTLNPPKGTQQGSRFLDMTQVAEGALSVPQDLKGKYYYVRLGFSYLARYSRPDSAFVQEYKLTT